GNRFDGGASLAEADVLVAAQDGRDALLVQAVLQALVAIVGRSSAHAAQALAQIAPERVGLDRIHAARAGALAIGILALLAIARAAPAFAGVCSAGEPIAAG